LYFALFSAKTLIISAFLLTALINVICILAFTIEVLKWQRLKLVF
jgi:hypothetical protein